MNVRMDVWMYGCMDGHDTAQLKMYGTLSTCFRIQLSLGLALSHPLVYLSWSLDPFL